jgi:hypothetical protein
MTYERDGFTFRERHELTDEQRKIDDGLREIHRKLQLARHAPPSRWEMLRFEAWCLWDSLRRLTLSWTVCALLGHHWSCLGDELVDGWFWDRWGDCYTRSCARCDHTEHRDAAPRD